MRKKAIQVLNNVAKYRMWKGFTQQKLAALTQISINQLRLIETEFKYPKYQVRSKLCSIFDILPFQLFESVQEELTQEELVQEELVQEEQIQEELVQEEQIQEELVQEEQIQEELVQEEQIQEELVQEELTQEEINIDMCK